MGLFLCMSGLKGVPRASLENALGAYARDHRMVFSPKSAALGDGEVLTIGSEGTAHTVIYPGSFMDWDAASAFLSTVLRTAVVSMHIHDGDFWMYVLYVDGKVVDRFNPDPEYWGELSDEERESWAGNPELLARHWDGLRVENVSRYFTTWDLEDPNPPKAYPDDEFSIGDDWQVVDFMRRLGLVYPDPGLARRDAGTFSFE